jgi:hypothetical protein
MRAPLRTRAQQSAPAPARRSSGERRTLDCSANGAVVGATIAFCTRPTLTSRLCRSCSGAAVKLYACAPGLAPVSFAR